MKKQIIILLLLIATLVASLTIVESAAAATIFENMRGAINVFDALPTAGDTPAQVENSVLVIIGRVLNAFLSIFGVIFLILVVYGGYRWMMARGNEDEVTKARDVIRNAIIGLILTMAAFAISVFISESIQLATSTPAAPAGTPATPTP